MRTTINMMKSPDGNLYCPDCAGSDAETWSTARACDDGEMPFVFLSTLGQLGHAKYVACRMCETVYRLVLPARARV